MEGSRMTLTVIRSNDYAGQWSVGALSEIAVTLTETRLITVFTELAFTDLTCSPQPNSKERNAAPSQVLS